MNKLKPCPFCGSKAISGNYYHGNIVGCSNTRCKVFPNTWYHDTLEEAIEAWNWRYTDEQTQTVKQTTS